MVRIYKKKNAIIYYKTLTRVLFYLQEAMSPRTHSSSPTALSHPRDKQEEETAAGTVKQARSR